MSTTAPRSRCSCRKQGEPDPRVSRTFGRGAAGYQRRHRDRDDGVQMLADTLTMVGAASVGLVGAMLVLMIVLHAYAWWTIRDIDRD